MVFKRRLKPVSTVDLIPMIDVIFQLVVFFMLSSTFIITPGITLELPSSSTAEPVILSQLVVTIVSENELYINDKAGSLSTMGNQLKNTEIKSTDENTNVIIEGDRKVSYSLMIKVLDILRQNGFTGISLKMKDTGN
ncbi:MAG: biopolymer transporter ExbD [Spirochaetaceae bacterium]|nr:biopolymer transporter ExbD [Spirochaetaceae bacterium]